MANILERRPLSWTHLRVFGGSDRGLTIAAAHLWSPRLHAGSCFLSHEFPSQQLSCLGYVQILSSNAAHISTGLRAASPHVFLFFLLLLPSQIHGRVGPRARVKRVVLYDATHSRSHDFLFANTHSVCALNLRARTHDPLPRAGGTPRFPTHASRRSGWMGVFVLTCFSLPLSPFSLEADAPLFFAHIPHTPD